jgi:hypothetical protein
LGRQNAPIWVLLCLDKSAFWGCGAFLAVIRWDLESFEWPATFAPES